LARSDASRDRWLRRDFEVDKYMGKDYTGEDESSNPFRDVLRMHGITDELIAHKLREELEAKTQQAFKGSIEEYDDSGNLVSKKTKIIYSKKMVAWDVRQRARMDAQKLLGLYPEERSPLIPGDGLLFGSLTGPLKVLLEDIIGKRKAIDVTPERAIDDTPKKIERQAVRILSFMEE